jgi:hypothetical protein
MVSFEHEIIQGACGISVFSDFNSRWAGSSSESFIVPSGGCGWVSAGFIVGNATCDEMFEWMESRGPCVYKTPVRVNRNSNNEFYFAIFDWSDNETAKYGFSDVDNQSDEEEFLIDDGDDE